MILGVFFRFIDFCLKKKILYFSKEFNYNNVYLIKFKQRSLTALSYAYRVMAADFWKCFYYEAQASKNTIFLLKKYIHQLLYIYILCMCMYIYIYISLYIYIYVICCLRQQRNDGGGSTTMRERPERVKSPDTYVIEWVSCGHFCLSLCSFGPPSHALVVITWRGEGCRYMMRLG